MHIHSNINTYIDKHAYHKYFLQFNISISDIDNPPLPFPLNIRTLPIVINGTYVRKLKPPNETHLQREKKRQSMRQSIMINNKNNDNNNNNECSVNATRMINQLAKNTTTITATTTLLLLLTSTSTLAAK